MTAKRPGEPDISDIADEPGLLASNLGERAVIFLKSDQRDKAIAWISEAVGRLIRDTSRSAAQFIAFDTRLHRDDD
jgi:hypothetical protein